MREKACCHIRPKQRMKRLTSIHLIFHQGVVNAITVQKEAEARVRPTRFWSKKTEVTIQQRRRLIAPPIQITHGTVAYQKSVKKLHRPRYRPDAV
jgi:hypothetical protein